MQTPGSITPTPGSPTPFGAERGSTASGKAYGVCSGANAEGIVPFRTLGLSRQDATDAWGNFFTYHVSPVFTLDAKLVNGATNTVAVPNALTRAEMDKTFWECRRANWYGGGGAHQNNAKARFCCPNPLDADTNYRPTNDIELFNVSNQDLISSLYQAGTRLSSSTPPAYDPTKIPQHYKVFTDSSGPATSSMWNYSTVFVLISHGENGHGAFRTDGTRISSSTAGSGEIENADGDNVFKIALRDTKEGAGMLSDHYDDIVNWYTQYTLLDLAGGTCQAP